MQFVTEDIDSYVSRKRNNHVHGNHIEIQAISEIFNRPVEIYAYHTGNGSKYLLGILLLYFRTHVDFFYWFFYFVFRFCELEPVNIFGLEQIKEGVEPLRLLYQRGSHYNAILNPYKPTSWSWFRFVWLSYHRWITKCQTSTGCGAYEWGFGNWTDNVWG